MKRYSIIDFKNDHLIETAIVPFSWVDKINKMCYWPDRRVPSKAVIDCITPEKTWKLFPFVGIKYESNDYRKVADKLKLLMDGVSDVASASENEKCLQRRRRLAKKRHWSSSDSDDETLCASTFERKAYSKGLQLPKLSFSCNTSQLPVQEAASNDASLASQGPASVSPPLSFVSGKVCSEELELPVRKAASNAASRESQGPSTFSLPPSVSMEACSEELQLSVREVDRGMQRIFKILEEIKKEQQEIKTQLLLLSHSDDNQHIGGGAPNDFSFPLKTEEEDLEDRDMKKKMIKYFSCIGGDSVAVLMRSMLRRLFSTPLALQYNFTGAKGKKGYNTLRVRGVMMTAVWKTFPQATEVEMNGVARKWFICARDRDGGRHRRFKPTTDSGSSSRLSGGAQ